MKLPFKQTQLSENVVVREFDGDTNESELVWHRDREDRIIKAISGTGWQLQIENNLPIPIKTNGEYSIPRNTYHRIIKGTSNLVLEITMTHQTQPQQKDNKMKITKRQLRQIIREEKSRLLNEKKRRLNENPNQDEIDEIEGDLYEKLGELSS